MKHRQLSAVAIAAHISMASFAQQPGDLDSTFHSDGIVTTPIGTTDDQARALVVQPDGKIVVAGLSYNGADPDFAVARYNPDGSLDNTFSTDGIVTTVIGSDYDEATAVALQPDGKIVVAGFALISGANEFAVVRYNTDGSLDNTFSSDGVLTTDIGTGHDQAYSVALQADGKIVVGGSAVNADKDLALVRYHPGGTLDTSFGGDGKVTTATGIGSSIHSVALQSDGKIVAAGRAGNNTPFTLARYNPDGSLDTSLDGDGIVTTPVGASYSIAHSVAITQDGKIIAAGRTSDGSQTDFAMVRYHPDGSPDTSFGVGGIVTTDISADDDDGYAMALQADGKIVMAGRSRFGTYHFAVARYNANGGLDTTFSSDGFVTFTTDTTGGGDDEAFGIAVQPNGKIVAAGYAYVNTGTDFIVVRYISEASVGLIDFSGAGTSALICPNPFGDNATLKYTLKTEETISIYLTDLSGRTLMTFVDQEMQRGGEHAERILLPESLPAGNYLIVIASERGRVSVQVVK